MSTESQVAFIIGSPRSGTTILGDILGMHPQIAQWYEPYFVWDYYLGLKETDIREVWEVTPKAKHLIRREFDYFRKKSRKDVIIDKSPEHSFKILFVNEVFPEARWIHILRDGRDVTLSIHKEWEKRRFIIENKDFIAFVRVAKGMLSRQPFLRHKWKALCYELRHVRSLKPSELLNKSKWQGQSGWGPRFQGWKEVLKVRSVLQFNAYQWLESINEIYKDLCILPADKVLEVRYEGLISKPKTILSEVFDFLRLSFPVDFEEKMPPLKAGNRNKWKREFSSEQLREIAPILTAKLLELGYEEHPDWADLLPQQGKPDEVEVDR